MLSDSREPCVYTGPITDHWLPNNNRFHGFLYSHISHFVFGFSLKFMTRGTHFPKIWFTKWMCLCVSRGQGWFWLPVPSWIQSQVDPITISKYSMSNLITMNMIIMKIQLSVNHYTISVTFHTTCFVTYVLEALVPAHMPIHVHTNSQTVELEIASLFSLYLLLFWTKNFLILCLPFSFLYKLSFYYLLLQNRPISILPPVYCISTEIYKWL